MREPDKRHYYYHQSLRTEETEAAEGVARCPRRLIQWEEAASAWLLPPRDSEVKRPTDDHPGGAAFQSGTLLIVFFLGP